MNEHVNPTHVSPETDLDDEQFAALDFEPWVHSDDEWTPPTNQEWCDAVNPTLIAIRMAWISLYKTKPELVGILNSMDNEICEDGESLSKQFLECILAASDRVSQINKVLECAVARLTIAGMSK
jgi:hypothetical protein